MTDGGVAEEDGYYGWVIATDTTILWEGNGYVPSNPKLLETLRAEGSSHLAMMVFLKHYCRYYGVSIQDDATIHFTDNKGVVGRMNWYQVRVLQTPSECLAPDFDVQAQVEAIYQELQINTPTRWVRGHQDKQKKKSWEAVLNIRADELATEARNQITTKDRTTTMTLLPACNAHLVIKGAPITRKITKTIRDEWCEVEVRKYCKKKYKWTKTKFDNVDWSASGKIHSDSGFLQQRFITRYIYKWLPFKAAKYTGR